MSPGRGAPRGLGDALRRHGLEYASEAAGLGLFMVSACAFGTLLEHPGSPVRVALADATLRRVAMGIAMGLTAVALVHSPWGRRSGAHVNPSVTLAFWRLGRVPGWDAALYAAAQVLGACAGVALMSRLLGAALAEPPVRTVVTVPGEPGVGWAFAAEAAISFVLMSVVLQVSASRWARWTGVCAGLLVAVWIGVEAPVSGMSMNPARSLGSSLVAGIWTAHWIYWTAPPLGMLLAAEIHARLRGTTLAACAKLLHDASRRCIFCEARAAREPSTNPGH